MIWGTAKSGARTVGTYRYVEEFMFEGNFDAAYALATELDTLVRDEIPYSIWKYLQKYTIDQE